MPDCNCQSADLIAERDIRRVLMLYCRAADRRDFDLMRSILREDAYLDFGHFQGGREDFIAHAASFPPAGSSQHHITNMLVERDGDRAEVEAYCIALLGGVPHGDGPQDCTVFVRYLDHLQRCDDRWLISRHIVVWDWNQNVPSTDSWSGPLHGNCRLRAGTGQADVSYEELPLIARL